MAKPKKSDVAAAKKVLKQAGLTGESRRGKAAKTVKAADTSRGEVRRGSMDACWGQGAFEPWKGTTHEDCLQALGSKSRTRGVLDPKTGALTDKARKKKSKEGWSKAGRNPGEEVEASETHAESIAAQDRFWRDQHKRRPDFVEKLAKKKKK